MKPFRNTQFFWLATGVLIYSLGVLLGATALIDPVPQSFQQEISHFHTQTNGLPQGKVQFIDRLENDRVRVLVEGAWYEWSGTKWGEVGHLRQTGPELFRFSISGADQVSVTVPWSRVRQVVRAGSKVWLATPEDPFEIVDGKAVSMQWPSRFQVHQLAASSDGNRVWIASSGGLFEKDPRGWKREQMLDSFGRDWGGGSVLGVAIDLKQQLWVATRAGVGMREANQWKFFEGKDGLPWNDFTAVATSKDGNVWFSTKLGAIRLDSSGWHYRQGKRWLPGDVVTQVVCQNSGDAWFSTDEGLGSIQSMEFTYQKKAEFYENEVERYIKRTSYGYVAEAPLRVPGDRSSANPSDSDNDGLWTAMYGAGQCFSYGATKDLKSFERASKAFEALRFLQKVTQGGKHSPPIGYVARTIRPVDWDDPNVGRIERDREEARRDKLWKVYEPRWPKSADGKWFWKSDTSSDELDGHYFFYPLYYDLCASEDAEKQRVREVVRDLTEHLIQHKFNLMDHDGRVTRWGVYGPTSLNRDVYWWPERGLNSLSMLSYLAVAEHVTGDTKYGVLAKTLVDAHGYLQNLMFPKVQHGPGSGNQSDDEMAFMCFYNLLKYSKDEAVKNQVRYSLFAYWAMEFPEMNPFFNFVCAASNLGAVSASVWGEHSVAPWSGWLVDAASTLKGFSLDRLNWAHKNSHRLDLVKLPPQQSIDLYEAGRRSRAWRVNGKVLPVENRHFNHWNTDPWHLDYGGNGNELASGTVFLLPYYMGLFHGYIQKP